MKLFYDLVQFYAPFIFGLSLDGADGGAVSGGAPSATATASDTPASAGSGNPAQTGTATTGQGGGATPATTTQGSHLGAYIDDKGAFKPGWSKGLGLPDTLESKFTSPESLLKSYVGLEKMLGNQNKVAIPGPNASPEERSAFYKQIGRPEKPEGYEIKRPEKIGDKAVPAEIWSDERAGNFAKLAHNIGLTKDQANALLGFDLENGIKTYDGIISADAVMAKQATDSLKAEWGGDYDKNLALARKAAVQAGGEELLSNPRLANDPGFIRAMAKVGGMIVEEPAAGARGTSHAQSDPKQEIAAIRGDKQHPYHVRGHPQHDAAVKHVADLYASAYPAARA
jgi:hypothetical protein